MKFNLKNRPKWEKQFEVEDLHDYASESYEWFEGFENELQQIAKALADFDDHYDAGKKALIKEILGEDK